jgi:phosphatidylglycerol:prolipoprotein diacylglycerol transferase
MTPGECFTALGFLTGAIVFAWQMKARHVFTHGMGLIAAAAIIGGVLGAKITEWLIGSGGSIAQFVNPHSGGRTIIGGIICGWLAVEFVKRRLGIRRSTGDLFALALPAGEAIGRIGCLLNGCCYGTVSNVPWAIYQHGAWRHPSQIYSSLAAILIFGILFYLRNRLTREGDLFRLYLLLYGIARFAIEFWRERNIAFGGLSTAQWVCIELIVVSCIMLLWPAIKKYRLQRRNLYAT